MRHPEERARRPHRFDVARAAFRRSTLASRRLALISSGSRRWTLRCAGAGVRHWQAGGTSFPVLPLPDMHAAMFVSRSPLPVIVLPLR